MTGIRLSGRVVLAAAAVTLLTVPAASSATAAPVKGCPDIQAFSQDMLRAHNMLRARHGSPPLVLDKDASNAAQKWADHLAVGPDGQVKHGGQEKPGGGDPGRYGQNISWIAGQRLPTAEAVAGSWYSEINNYNFDNPGVQPGRGSTENFTQLVWAATKKLGVGVACKPNPNHGMQMYTVTDYDPAGNYLDGYDDNVRRPRS
ncbi:CAP family protein [Nocardia brasiliensis]|uniref:CAP family protein n=1 Tax=Nocardia brasiliensis TaxID=37326 RepID=UPI00142D8F65|nr:CAP family protein [Nocardia brasiliensis]